MRRKALRISKRLFALALTFAPLGMLILSCGARVTTGPARIDTSCESFRIIRPHHNDTPKTRIQVAQHNRVWRSLCAAR